jgi:hypothetical protein
LKNLKCSGYPWILGSKFGIVSVSLIKMKNRKLIDEEEFSDLMDKLDLVRKLINGNISKMPSK